MGFFSSKGCVDVPYIWIGTSAANDVGMGMLVMVGKGVQFQGRQKMPG